ncbi:hypothetical protein [Streptomyces purpurascens]
MPASSASAGAATSSGSMPSSGPVPAQHPAAGRVGLPVELPVRQARDQQQPHIGSGPHRSRRRRGPHPTQPRRCARRRRQRGRHDRQRARRRHSARDQPDQAHRGGVEPQSDPVERGPPGEQPGQRAGQQRGTHGGRYRQQQRLLRGE